MKNYKCIEKQSLLNNLQMFKNKKICAMVKANAYGHGIKNIVPIIEKNVDILGL